MQLFQILSRKDILLFALSVAVLGVLTFDGLAQMVHQWESDEYSHGYMIPLVALYLAWQKRAVLVDSMIPGSLLGVVVVLLAILMWLMGEISSIYVIIQYAFVVGVLGISLVFVGVKAVKSVWAAIFYLVFMIPLPNFLYANLSQELQLISSSIGVAVIRLFDISVFLEGNVIDLGVYQLQVVEACSGLRYLFPLVSFGFLIAYIYKGPLWQRVVIFLSTIPITVLMNSFRIGVIGVTVEYFGIAAAEGFLHDFEGWIVFMACLGVLLLEIWVFYLFSNKQTSFASLFDLDFGAGQQSEVEQVRVSRQSGIAGSAWVVLALLVVMLPASYYITERKNEAPARTSFNLYPLQKDDWIGRETALEQNVLNTLKLSDYIIGDFQRVDDAYPVNFYVAWYEEQRKGASIHSPKSCLPGGGWQIQQHTVEPVEEIDAYGQPLQVNRVLMQMGEHRQLVYYWFHGRSRIITNEYMAKWYIFWDSLTRNRTDGALVRLVTYVPDGSDIAEADQRMVDYLHSYFNELAVYVPN